MTEMSRVLGVSLLLTIVSVLGVSALNDAECYETSDGHTYYRVVLDDSKTHCFDHEYAKVETVTSGCDCASKAEAMGMNSFMMVNETTCEMYVKVANEATLGALRSEERVVYSVDQSLEHSTWNIDVQFSVEPGWLGVTMTTGEVAWHLEENCEVGSLLVFANYSPYDRVLLDKFENPDLPVDGSTLVPSSRFQCLGSTVSFLLYTKNGYLMHDFRWQNPKNSTMLGNVEGTFKFGTYDDKCVVLSDVSGDYAASKGVCEQAGGFLYGKPFSADFRTNVVFDNDMWVGLVKHPSVTTGFVWYRQETAEFSYDDKALTNPTEARNLECVHVNAGSDPYTLTAADCDSSHNAMCYYEEQEAGLS